MKIPPGRRVVLPELRAEDPEVLQHTVPFSTYMERAMADPDFGYYATGRVEFGRERHFETFVHRVRPFFGRLYAEAAREVLAELVASGALPADAHSRFSSWAPATARSRSMPSPGSITSARHRAGAHSSTASAT